MADHINTNSDIDNTNTTSDTEPATKHDIGIGGGLGAVGGAIVGALAGGPVGAVIGAIAGGAASAGAIDVVDKHDHDFARTEGTTGTVGTTGYNTGAAVDNTPLNTGAGYAGVTGAGYADTMPTDASYANTGAASTIDADTDRTVQLHEERLSATTQPVQTGEVSLHKEVITETKSIDVPVTREEVVIERHAVSGAAAAGSFDTNTDEVIRVPVMEEQVMVQKTPMVTEEISLGKREVTENQRVTDTVRREEAYIDNPDNVDVLERGAASTKTDRI